MKPPWSLGGAAWWKDPMDFYSRYQKNLLSRYPEVRPFLKDGSWQSVVFPERVSVPAALPKEMARVVRAIDLLKTSGRYLDFLEPRAEGIVKASHPQDSVLMAFDFHIDSKGRPRLIEVNTNASGFLITNILYQTHGAEWKTPLKDLIRSFQEEWRVFQESRGADPKTPPRRTVIMDENPPEQKMIWEFFMYKRLFHSMGWRAEVCDSSDLKESPEGLRDAKGRLVDFVYNRSTDFYFKKAPHLAAAYRSDKTCFSPHPSQYGLLADKTRLCEWTSFKFLKAIEKNLTTSRLLTAETASEAWENRKNLFFKILRGHGGKQAYRGKSLTRKKFQHLLSKGEALFQEYIPPPLFQDSRGKEWKFDLRAYAYRGRIQQIVARCYKGQVTNFQNEGGGFSAVCVPPSLKPKPKGEAR